MYKYVSVISFYTLDSSTGLDFFFFGFKTDSLS